MTELATSFDEQFEIIPNVVDGEDAYKKLEQVESLNFIFYITFTLLSKIGSMIRLDPSIWPTKQKCATVGDSLNY